MKNQEINRNLNAEEVITNPVSQAKARKSAGMKSEAEARKAAKLIADKKIDAENRRELEVIAVQIRSHEEQVELFKSQAEECKNQEGHSNFEMGRLLTDAKVKIKKVKGAKWLDWLGENFKMTPRHAQYLMKTYKALGNTNAISHLGYTKALILATLPSEKRDAFISSLKDGESISAEEMTTREFEKAIREHKGPKAPPVPPKVTVERFSKRVTSLGTQLDDLVKSLSRVDGDSDACRKLLSELLSDRAAKLFEQQ